MYRDSEMRNADIHLKVSHGIMGKFWSIMGKV